MLLKEHEYLHFASISKSKCDISLLEIQILENRTFYRPVFSSTNKINTSENINDGKSIASHLEYRTASPISEIQQCPSDLTRIFFDVTSRCAMAGFPCVPVISV